MTNLRNTTLAWMLQNTKLPKDLPYDFTNRQFQVDIINNQSKQMAICKCTQIGMSTMFLIKSFHFLDTNNVTLMYTMPRQDDVTTFVNTRVEEIIRQSPYLADRINEVDNVRIKRFNKSFIHFTELSVMPRSVDVDMLCVDELDLSDPINLDSVVARLDASKYGIYHRFSTPSIDNYGIDAVYKQSNQKKWLITCSYCNHEFFMDWYTNVAEKAGKAWYKCGKCGNPLHADDIREGRWVITGSRNSDIDGYHISQMMVPYISPTKLWNEFKTMDRKIFYNFRLGEPYTPKSAAIDRELILENCLETNHKKEYNRDNQHTYVLGCDQGNTLHVSVGKIVGEKIEIVSLQTIDFEHGFPELGKIIRRYGIRRAIVDALPNHHDSKNLAKDFPNKMYVAYFSSISELYKVEDDKININKTDAYDRVLESLVNGQIQFYTNDGQLTSEVDTAISHLCNMRRDLEIRKSKFGGLANIHVWKNVGPDHYADAILYMLMAADSLSTGRVKLDVIDIGSLVKDDIYTVEELYGLQRGLEEHSLVNNIRRESHTRENNEEILYPDNPYIMRRREYER